MPRRRGGLPPSCVVGGCPRTPIDLPAGGWFLRSRIPPIRPNLSVPLRASGPSNSSRIARTCSRERSANGTRAVAPKCGQKQL
eukprot:12699760-Alexandrium_andersonii.AAC.1